MQSSPNPDSNFSHCLGAECPTPCCDVYGGIPLHPDEIEPTKEVVSEINSSRGLDVMISVRETRRCLQNCMQDGVCQLGENRPSICSIYPLTIRPVEPKPGDTVTIGIADEDACPQVAHVPQDRGFISGVVRLVEERFGANVVLSPELSQ